VRPSPKTIFLTARRRDASQRAALRRLRLFGAFFEFFRDLGRGRKRKAHRGRAEEIRQVRHAEERDIRQAEQMADAAPRRAIDGSRRGQGREERSRIFASLLLGRADR
jgi:hypothetical protein